MLIIRADGNARTGAGHLMRCLTIARAVSRRSETEVLFLCADRDSAGLVWDHGFPAEILGTDYRDMESERWERWVSGSGNRILVDSYYVTDAYLEGLARYGRVWLMDDLQEHPYPVDGVINYNLFAEKERYAALYEGRTVELCLGSRFVPLREQFRKSDYQVRDEVEDALITVGGGDADNIAEKILDAVYREHIVYHVLTGRFHPHFEKWKIRAEQTANLQLHYDVKDMARLMERCDLAITAGGSTVYELAAVGTPFICFACAPNQEALAGYLGRGNIAVNAGVWRRDPVSTLKEIQKGFTRLCADRDLRRRMSDRQRQLADGYGADRLAEILCGK